MTLSLKDIKVVDVSQVVAVPMAARLLAEWGADVIHVEHPVAGDLCRGYQAGLERASGVHSDVDYIWENYNCNKRGMTLDLSQEGGREVLYKLVAKADVFLTNLRPFQLERFKVEYDNLSALNPGLIYGAVNGFGKKGPERDAPAYDHHAYWGRGGIRHRLTALAPELLAPGVPPLASPGAFGDHMAGMALACGVMTALFLRERSGVGQEVNVSLFHSAVYQLSWDIAGTLVTGRDCEPRHSREENPHYQTKDGRWLLFGGVPEHDWPRFCQAIGREDLEHDPRFESLERRREHHTALFHILEEVFKSRTLKEWTPVLNEMGRPWSPVQTLPEVVNDPQARANDFFIAYDHPPYGRIEVVANPIKLSKTPTSIRMPAPEFSQHTEEILLELGYTWEDIERFKEQRVTA